MIAGMKYVKKFFTQIPGIQKLLKGKMVTICQNGELGVDTKVITIEREYLVGVKVNLARLIYIQVRHSDIYSKNIV